MVGWNGCLLLDVRIIRMAVGSSTYLVVYSSGSSYYSHYSQNNYINSAIDLVVYWLYIIKGGGVVSEEWPHSKVKKWAYYGKVKKKSCWLPESHFTIPLDLTFDWVVDSYLYLVLSVLHSLLLVLLLINYLNVAHNILL